MVFLKELKTYKKDGNRKGIDNMPDASGIKSLAFLFIPLLFGWFILDP